MNSKDANVKHVLNNFVTRYVTPFHNLADYRDAYVHVKIPKRETKPARDLVLNLESGDFPLLIKHELAVTGISDRLIRDCIQQLISQARYGTKKHPLGVRIAALNDVLYIDLADDAGRVVKVSDEGWSIIGAATTDADATAAGKAEGLAADVNQNTETCPIKFVRTPGMLPLPIPTDGGSIDMIKTFLNVREADLPLVLGWVLMAYTANGPYPVLFLGGEQDSGKSTTERVLLRLIDPNAADVRSAPRNERELMEGAGLSWVQPFDNLSSIPNSLSDALCRMSTGGGGNNSSGLVASIKRPVVFNSIDDMGLQSDLLDRTLWVMLKGINDERRKQEEAFWPEFETLRPQIFGWLLSVLVEARKRASTLTTTALPRMADFARLVMGAEEAMGMEPGSFLNAYEENRKTADSLVVESSAVGAAVRKLMLTWPSNEWVGTAQDLLDYLIDKYPIDMSRSGRSPETARKFSGLLRRVAPHLRRLGYDVQFERSADSRTILVKRTRDLTEKELKEVEQMPEPQKDHEKLYKLLNGIVPKSDGDDGRDATSDKDKETSISGKEDFGPEPTAEEWKEGDEADESDDLDV